MDASLSLFELPVSRGARVVRIGLVLALDALLIVAGVALAVAHLDGRTASASAPTRSSASDATPSTVAKEPSIVVLTPRPSLRSPLGTPSVAEVAGLAAALEAAGRAETSGLRSCLARAAGAVATAGPLAGDVVLSTTLAPDGRLGTVRVIRNQTGSAALGACVAALVSSWSLPAGAAEPLALEWPFQFGVEELP